jgi:hypothetical protein
VKSSEFKVKSAKWKVQSNGTGGDKLVAAVLSLPQSGGFLTMAWFEEPMTPSSRIVHPPHDSTHRGRTLRARPAHWNSYEFVVVAALRAQQLQAGCVPRLDGQHSAATMAQMEVAEGRVVRAGGETPVPSRQCGWQL